MQTTNRLPAEVIEDLLENHGIGYANLGGRIIAEDRYTTRERSGEVILHCDLLDVTDYTKPALMRWLGY